MDARTTHHPGDTISQQKRKRTEQSFGWAKTIGGVARPMLRGAAGLRFKFTFATAAYDLIRLPKALVRMKSETTPSALNAVMTKLLQTASHREF